MPNLSRVNPCDLTIDLVDLAHAIDVANRIKSSVRLDSVPILLAKEMWIAQDVFSHPVAGERA
jgi:hypothetical protein